MLGYRDESKLGSGLSELSEVFYFCDCGSSAVKVLLFVLGTHRWIGTSTRETAAETDASTHLRRNRQLQVGKAGGGNKVGWNRGATGVAMTRWPGIQVELEHGGHTVHSHTATDPSSAPYSGPWASDRAG